MTTTLTRPNLVGVPSGWYRINGVLVYYDAVTQNFFLRAVTAQGIQTMSQVFPFSLPWHTPPKVIDIGPGEKLQVTLRYSYVGPVVTGVNEKFKIGIYSHPGFDSFNPDESLTGTYTRNLAQTTTAQQYTRAHTFTMPTREQGFGTNWNALLVEVSGGSPQVNTEQYGYNDCIHPIGLDPNISTVEIVDFSKVA